MNPLQPALTDARVGSQPFAGGYVGRFMVREDRPHDFAFALSREYEVLQQLAYIGTLPHIAGPGEGQHPGATVVWTEGRVPAAQVAQIELHVHGMRVPRQE